PVPAGESAERPPYLPHRARGAGGPHRPTGSRRERPLAPISHPWAPVPVELGAPGGSPARRGALPPPRLPPAQRVSLRTARISRVRLHLQARPDPGGRLRHGAARAAQSLT